MQGFPMSFSVKCALVFVGLLLTVTMSFSQGNRSSAGEIPPAPDYSNIRNWASHPSIHDKGDSIPKPLRKIYSYDSTIDVFFHSSNNIFKKSE